MSDGRPVTYGSAVCPIELMYESNGLFHYSAHCCLADDHWGTLVSSSNTVACGCANCQPIPGVLLEATWAQGAAKQGNTINFDSVFISDNTSQPNTNRGFIVNKQTATKATKASDTYQVKPGIANPPQHVQDFCNSLANVMFDLYTIDYSYAGGSGGIPPRSRIQHMFAGNPQDVMGRPKDLLIKNVVTATGRCIALCQAGGQASETLVISF